ncbi:MAG: prolyl oligopeptidase family serine peptidase [Burkholderiales bacterium]|nr:prolyl oligopeptidase family serine peptidase [Burkholderiales bacterium]
MRGRLGATLLLPGLWLAPAGAAETLVPVAAFAGDGVFSRPKLSPDGQRLAVIVERQDGDRVVPTLVIYEVPELKVAAVLRTPFRQVMIEHHWVDDMRLVMSNGLEIGRYEAPLPIGNIYASDIDGQRQRYLYGSGRGDTRSMSSAGDTGNGDVHSLPSVPNGHFYLRDNRRPDDKWATVLFDVDSVTGARQTVATLPLPGLSFLLQSDGKPRFAFGSDADNRWVLFRRAADGPWARVPQAAHDGRLGPFAFTPDNRAVYATFTRDGGPDSLVRQSMEGDDRATLVQHESGSIDILQFGPGAAPQPFAAASNVGIPRMHYFEPDRPEAQLHQALAAQFPGAFVNFLSWSADGQRLLFSVISDRDPGAFYLWDQRTAKAHLLYAQKTGIDPSRMGERRPISFEARDGVPLHGYLTLPAGREASNLPLVLLPHGGPHGVADTWYFDEDAQFLASRGYAVLQVNFRGSSGRGLAFHAAGFRHWGDEVQDDLIDGVKWAIDTGVADASRVCAYGVSFGAYASMMVITRAPGLFKCAVGQAGLYDLPLWYQARLGQPQAQKVLAEYFGADEQAQAAISPSRLAELINVPVLLVHGSVDGTTPLEQGTAMRKALAKAKKPHEWVEVSGEGHGFYSSKNQIDFYQRLEAFLARHIGKP